MFKAQAKINADIATKRLNKNKVSRSELDWAHNYRRENIELVKKQMNQIDKASKSKYGCYSIASKVVFQNEQMARYLRVRGFDSCVMYGPGGCTLIKWK